MYNNKTVGLSIITYQRPVFCDDAWRSAWGHLQGIVDHWFIVDDGSGPAFASAYDAIQASLPAEITFVRWPVNRNVAATKNEGLKRMMEAGCDYLFLMEDDIKVTSPKAVTGYLDMHVSNGYHHFNFAHHGRMNGDYRRDVAARGVGLDIREDGLEHVPACVGAWSFYTRHCIEVVGYMDENFQNAYEHVEHSARISHAGLANRMWDFVDVPGSDEWLMEQPDSLENTTMPETPEKMQNIERMLNYWRNKDLLSWS